jgi:hypothetical protein
MCSTTDLALHPNDNVTFIRPENCPVNGFGGDWYRQPFQGVPIYNLGAPGVIDHVSWYWIDQWATRFVSNVWVTTGACLGLCIASLTYNLALTPSKKRGLPFHTCHILALLSEIARLLCDIGRASSVGMSPYSAYLGLTKDYAATTYSPAFEQLEIAGMICATLAFIFTTICLYLQTLALTTGLQLNHHKLFFGIMAYLITASIVALGFRMAITTIRSIYVFRPLSSFPYSVFAKLRMAMLILYAISLGSWCTVSLISVFWLMYTRSQLIVSNRMYDTGLTLLTMVFLESMIVPCKRNTPIPTNSPIQCEMHSC